MLVDDAYVVSYQFHSTYQGGTMSNSHQHHRHCRPRQKPLRLGIYYAPQRYITEVSLFHTMKSARILDHTPWFQQDLLNYATYALSSKNESMENDWSLGENKNEAGKKGQNIFGEGKFLVQKNIGEGENYLWRRKLFGEGIYLVCGGKGEQRV